MKKESVITTFCLLVLWHVSSAVFNNEFLLPAPFEVLCTMFEQLSHPDFLSIMLNTSARAVSGCLIALVFAGALGITAGLKPSFQRYFTPVQQLIQTIPNITYMILILIWLGQERSVFVIVFFILFPVFYAQFKDRTEMIGKDMHHLLTIYPVSFQYKWFRIFLPMMLPDMFNALKTGIGMGFKVCIMAEILGQVKSGIGRQMNIARLHLDLASVFAWTIWAILISILLQKAVDIVQKLTCEKYE